MFKAVKKLRKITAFIMSVIIFSSFILAGGLLTMAADMQTLLYKDTEAVLSDSWESFRYIINRQTPADESRTTLERSKGGRERESAGAVCYNAKGKTLQIAAPEGRYKYCLSVYNAPEKIVETKTEAQTEPESEKTAEEDGKGKGISPIIAVIAAAACTTAVFVGSIMIKNREKKAGDDANNTGDQ